MDLTDFPAPRYALRDDGVMKRCNNAAEVMAFQEGGHDVTIVTKTPECDFCSLPDEPQYRKYGCLDFEIIQLGQRCGAEGAWAACAECERLIEAKDKAGLAERAIAKFMQRMSSAAISKANQRDLASDMRAHVLLLHEGFFLNRTGHDHKEPDDLGDRLSKDDHGASE